ncbi:MAG: PIN domain-containing protein [Promicromonosporaceae bacterium]|nr:PIN domain-containing protein [Promicromonosporaceae bacterium]
MVTSRVTNYIDSSVLLRALLGESPAAANWINNALASGDTLVSATLLDTEVRRVVHNKRLQGMATPTDALVNQWLSSVVQVKLSEKIMSDATRIKSVVGTLDALHVATAMTLRNDNPVVVTHDAQMATAAKVVRLKVIDPVTDDPNRAPVA